MQLSKSNGLVSLVRGAHRRTRRVRGDGLLKRVPRHRRSSASPVCELGRSVLRTGASVTTGTPASQFVALEAPRLDSVQRHHWDLLRGVALRPVASAYRNSPRNTLRGVLAKWRQTARRKTSKRISERFAGQRVEVRFVVASESGQWRSLSEVVDTVLISLGRASSAPAGTTAAAPSGR
jgi:hypothetical protein